ncbi:MAG: ABC transporter ATP-binding protein, partial [Pseudobdellovibrionaceae bacterium]|nr:ABC transporter ATP-binding protein [Pseudobdellovibrionaceae bacterium]
GSIRLGNTELLALSESEMEKVRGGRMAMIFQEPMTALNPVLKIGDQISEQILAHEERISVAEAWERAIEMLKLVGIPSPQLRVHQYPHELSGGMRQRAMIAMALSTRPQFLIADEPTTALDVTIQAQILQLIQEVQEKFKMSVQFITHDLGVISEIADRVLVMYGGLLCELAPSTTIFSQPRHPYTLALLEARPRLGKKVERLKTIEGTVPGILERPTGCPFSNRCPRALPECAQLLPDETHISSQHVIRCFNPEPKP